MQTIAGDIRALIDNTKPQLLAISTEDAGTKPAPERWSKKETLGHLIDSAANNHQRFVRAQYGQALAFKGYDQNAWVALQHYNDLPWEHLIELWYAYNRHLCEVILRIPPDARESLCDFGREKPVALAFVVEDYLRHLRHHLDTITG